VFSFLVLFVLSFVGGQRGGVSPLARLRRTPKESS
jgi:hypothetical protein